MDNFDLKKFVSEKTLLNENAPGYDTRKTGEPLPTLESVKAAYEAKQDKEDLDEGIKDKIDAKLMKLLDAVGFDKFADVLIDKFGIDEFPDRLYNAIKKMPGGEKILDKIYNMSALKEEKEEIKEGVWNMPSADEVMEFVAYMEDAKEKFYHIGSDAVHDGLEQAIISAKDLVTGE